MKVQRIALFLILTLFLVSDVSAIGRRRYRVRTTYRSSSSYSAPANCYSGTDQERCQAEAEYMAAHGIFAHVGALIGNFEGWGYGGRNCSTCTPRSGMRLTGDGWASGPGGSFRVRSWRY